MEKATEARTAPVLGEGAELTGGWRVVRVLGEVAGFEAVIVEDDAFGVAFCFLLSADSPDPELDESWASAWGTVRRILRDERFGRLVLDEVPSATLLADRLAEGWTPPSAWHDQLLDHVRGCHREGRWHGQIAADRVVIGVDGLALPGWGLGGVDPEDAKARDLAALSAIAGMAPTPAPAPSPPHSPAEDAEDSFDLDAFSDEALSPAPPAEGRASPEVAALRTAMASDHLPTLRSALAAWVEADGATELPEVLLARDALARLEQKVAAALDKAQGLLQKGDSLGAVAMCREAVRLGAEEEAEPVLREARKQARAMLSRRRLPSLRVLAISVAGFAALALLVVAGWLSFRDAPEDRQLAEQVAETVRRGGERSAVSFLASLRSSGVESPRGEELLAEHLERLVDQERAMMLSLRREVVSRGARPHRADQLAEEAFTELSTLATTDFSSPILPERVSRAIVLLDKAAALYRVDTELHAEQAVIAVDLLLREDPLFQGDGGGASR